MLMFEPYLKRFKTDNKFLKFFNHFIIILVISFVFALFPGKALWTLNIALSHSLAELICIFIALSAFVVVWHTHIHNPTINIIFSFGFLSVAFFDFFHMYYYPALNLFPDSYTDLSARYWIIGRFIQTFILLLYAFDLREKRINKWLALGITLTISIAAYLIILEFPHIMPPLKEGNKVTMFKIYLEYIVIILSAVIFFRLLIKANQTNNTPHKCILIAVSLIIPTEFCLTLYKSIFSFYQVYGHVLKVITYICFYKATFVNSIAYPYKKLEKANYDLKESRNRLGSILNTFNGGIIAYDENLVVSYVNKKALELLECESDNIIGLSYLEMEKFFMKNPEVSNIDALYSSMQFKSNNTLQHCRTLKGKDIIFNVEIINLKRGKLICFSDVTKDQELSNLKIQTTTILNSISNLVLVTDTNLDIIMVNKALTDCFEMESNKLLGMNLNYLYKEINFSSNTDNDILTPVKSCEATIISQSGTKKTLLFSYSAVTNASNKIIGYIGVYSDTTILKEEQRKYQQQEKLAVIGQMGSGIVHETKNHLASIKGYCQLLLSRIDDNQLKSFVGRIETITGDVNKIISDFLTLAKPNESIKDICSLNETIKSMRYLLESPSFMKGINVDIDLDVGDMDILADESQLKQLILNLSKNAIEAMEEKVDAKLSISTGFDKSTNKTHLIISDNGKGISKENLKKIGSPFFTTKESGSGLGLNVCFRIIKEHDADIDVTSEIGKGTTFKISFPCYEEQNNQTA